jgi:hypothetical protein
MGAKTSPDDSSKENVLEGKYGAKRLFLWSRPVDAQNSKDARSCWYYKEATPAKALTGREALTEREALIEALITSVKLNDFSLQDREVQIQLERLIKEKLIGAGADFIPCGLSATSTGISLAGLFASAGITSLAFGLSAAATANTCISNYDKIVTQVKAWKGASNAIGSLQKGETTLGDTYPASKWELDMYREAIKRAVSLGHELQPSCLTPKEFKNEINKKTNF